SPDLGPVHRRLPARDRLGDSHPPRSRPSRRDRLARWNPRSCRLLHGLPGGAGGCCGDRARPPPGRAPAFATDREQGSRASATPRAPWPAARLRDPADQRQPRLGRSHAYQATEGVTHRNRLPPRARARARPAPPRRPLAAWGAAALVAIVAIVALLGGALSTDNHPTDNRQSQRAAALIDRSFPASSRTANAELVVVRSDRYSVDAPQFRSAVEDLSRELRGIDGVARVTSYLDGGGLPLVSRDRHATIVPVNMPGSKGIDQVISAVSRVDANPAFRATITGDQTRQHDFNKLSQSDLRSGELQFGLPASLIVLLLVFGAVVAGLIPLLMAMFSIVIGLGVVAALAHACSLSVFTVNMLTGMGLALGIDYALFV